MIHHLYGKLIVKEENIKKMFGIIIKNGWKNKLKNWFVDFHFDLFHFSLLRLIKQQLLLNQEKCHMHHFQCQEDLVLSIQILHHQDPVCRVWSHRPGHLLYRQACDL
jgi:hypothetical protein